MARKQMARSLPENWDVSIAFATNGKEALELIRAGQAEILFLDLNMPVMDGYEVLQAIRADDLPAMVVVVSGDIQPEAYKRVIALGALDFIKKPVSPGEIETVLAKYGIPVNKTGRTMSLDIKVDLRDGYQEIINVAMGRSANLLARLLDVFIELPVPRVNMLEVTELQMLLQQIDAQQDVSALCQGFIGSGLAGEALMIFNESSYSEIAELMKQDGEITESVKTELLMDISNILIGAILKGIADQLDVNFSQGHPVLLGQHIRIAEILDQMKVTWKQTLAIEIPYRIKNRNISCDLLILFSEDSIKSLDKRISYILE